MSADCLVCGRPRSWHDPLTGDILCATCSEWAAPARLIHHLTSLPVAAIQIVAVEEIVEGLDNGWHGAHVTLKGEN